MKKKLLTCLSVLTLLLSMTVTSFAAQPCLVSSPKSVFRAFFGCKPATIAGIVFIMTVIAAVVCICNKKTRVKLENPNASQMMNTFIAFFSVMGIASLGLALATDGQAWLDMMHRETTVDVLIPHFSDYAMTVRHAGSQAFEKSCDRFSPMGLFIFFLLAQFLPQEYILNTSSLTYAMMFKNQTVILLYLFLVLFAVVLIYKMNRSVLHRNGLRIKDELVLFLTVVSFPSIYCIEMGNIAGVCLTLVMFFILFRNAEKRLLRELSLVFLGLSAAITPYTLVFALLLLDKKDKKNLTAFIRTVLYFVVMFICPAFFTGFDNMFTYITSFVSIAPNGYTAGNMSIANLLVFFGIKNSAVLYIFTILTEAIAMLCVLKLPSMWQKTAAIVYTILNIFSISENAVAIFIFIPFIFFLAENKHKTIDWLYFAAFTLMITPLPEWYYFSKSSFSIFLNTFGLPIINSANELFSLAAIQMIFVLTTYQTVRMISKTKVKAQNVGPQSIDAQNLDSQSLDS